MSWYAAVDSRSTQKLQNNVQRGEIMLFREDGGYLTFYSNAAQSAAAWHLDNGRRLARSHSDLAYPEPQSQQINLHLIQVLSFGI